MIRRMQERRKNIMRSKSPDKRGSCLIRGAATLLFLTLIIREIVSMEMMFDLSTCLILQVMVLLLSVREGVK